MAHVLHMNGGTEDTSYAANSLLQRKVISMTRPIIEEAAMGLFSSSSFSGRNLAIADLGCASGPNTLFTVSELIKALDKASRKLGHVSLEFQVPPGLEEMNKGNISIGSSSPPGVLKAYYTQFQTDFSFFLSCRAQELVRGGQIIFTLLGRKSQGPSTTPSIHLLELLFVVLNQMASEGLIDQEKLDSFDLPFYMPSPMEVETEIQKQGSFTIKRLEVWESNWNPHDMEVNLPETLQDGGHNVARCIRAVMEPQLVSQFALQRKIVDEVFMRYRVILSNWMCEKEALYVNITVSLTKH
ncbi:unnamed protein product [Linum tenue]|uniref:Uncharacterized protein n=1 Tax=Linum tenue TaxID=586396 RepID=A0AAV0I409_9ROSI|nr:unnamed protein product [Linum tenue]